MKHNSVFYALPVKIITAVLCCACILCCAFCTLRTVWDVAVGIFDTSPTCRILQDGCGDGDIYIPNIYDGKVLWPFSGDPDPILNYIGACCKDGAFPEIIEDKGLLCPAGDAASFFDADTFRKSNLLIRIRLRNDAGEYVTVFSNMEDLEKGDSSGLRSYSFSVMNAEIDDLLSQDGAKTYHTAGWEMGYDEGEEGVGYIVTFDGSVHRTWKVRAGIYEYGLRRTPIRDDEYAVYYRAWERDSQASIFWPTAACVSGAAGIFLLVLLLMQAGIRRGCEDVRLSFFDRLPAELALGIHTLIAVFIWFLLIKIFEYRYLHYLGALFGYCTWSDELRLCSLVLLVLSGILLADVLHFLVCTTRRIRAGGIRAGEFLKNSIIFRILHLFWRLLVTLFLFVSAALSNMRILWKWYLFCAIFGLWTLFVICIRDEIFIILYGISFLVCLAAGALFFMGMDRVCRGAEVISSGKLDYKIEEKRLIGVPFALARSLNQIQSAMQTAVNEQMRSERFRTELITNVSHDLKTPLTSIVSYTDLLSREEEKEEPDRAAEREYIDVLSRQSDRLRRLTEDLIEASKASAGTLPVSLASLDAGELLTQALGEYEARLTAAELTPVISIPPEGMSVYADGRHLWRVFDNLLSNICKYSLHGTRVYFSAERDDGRVRLIFRNISAYPLNVDAEELVERFVRGDESRHTEGSGLGLAIAHSLTALQNGTLTVSTDGDLFKVIVELPKEA